MVMQSIFCFSVLFKKTLGSGFYHLLKTKAKNPTNKKNVLVIAFVLLFANIMKVKMKSLRPV